MSFQPSDFERALRPPHRLLSPAEEEQLRATARLKFWQEPRPADIRARELENSRRMFLLGNLSGLWDALARCSIGSPVISWGLPVPDWLAEALAVVIAEHAPGIVREALGSELQSCIGSQIPKALFDSLDSVVRRYLRSVKIAKTGRYTYWLRRWVGDLVDAERFDYMEHLRVDVLEEAREALENLSHSPASPELEEHRQWRRFLLYQSRWTDDRVAAMVAAELNSPRYPVLRAQTVLESRKRVMQTTLREPWRYTIGALAHMELAWRDEIRRRERGNGSELSRLSKAFELWKAEEGTRRRVSRSR